jgi:ketosteroid isomerase-like protein
MVLIFTFTLMACRGGSSKDSGSITGNSSKTVADWVFIGITDTGEMYYDKSSIKNENNNIVRVETKKILNDDRKTENPGSTSYMLIMNGIDCVNNKIKPVYSNTKYNNWHNYAPNSVTKYNDWDNIIPNSVIKYGQWYDITPNSVAEKLKNIVCGEPAAVKTAVAVSKVSKPVSPPKVVIPAVATVVTDKNVTQVNSKQSEKKSAPGKDVEKLVSKWLTGWKSGDMNTYRSCYASDFQSKGRDLDAYVSDKANAYRKNKNIKISIDNLHISADGNIATASFTQHYSTSKLKFSGKKKLEFKKINNEWKIYREMM